jgi:hypothetical protein
MSGLKRLAHSNGLTERTLNLGIISANIREKHAAEPVQFGTPPPFFGSFRRLAKNLKK